MGWLRMLVCATCEVRVEKVAEVCGLLTDCMRVECKGVGCTAWTRRSSNKGRNELVCEFDFKTLIDNAVKQSISCWWRNKKAIWTLTHACFALWKTVFASQVRKSLKLPPQWQFLALALVIIWFFLCQRSSVVLFLLALQVLHFLPISPFESHQYQWETNCRQESRRSAWCKKHKLKLDVCSLFNYLLTKCDSFHPVDEKKIIALMKDFFENSSNGMELTYTDLKKFILKQREQSKVGIPRALTSAVRWNPHTLTHLQLHSSLTFIRSFHAPWSLFYAHSHAHSLTWHLAPTLTRSLTHRCSGCSVTMVASSKCEHSFVRLVCGTFDDLLSVNLSLAPSFHFLTLDSLPPLFFYGVVVCLLYHAPF